MDVTNEIRERARTYGAAMPDYLAAVGRLQTPDVPGRNPEEVLQAVGLSSGSVYVHRFRASRNDNATDMVGLYATDMEDVDNMWPAEALQFAWAAIVAADAIRFGWLS